MKKRCDGKKKKGVIEKKGIELRMTIVLSNNQAPMHDNRLQVFVRLRDVPIRAYLCLALVRCDDSFSDTNGSNSNQGSDAQYLEPTRTRCASNTKN